MASGPLACVQLQQMRHMLLQLRLSQLERSEFVRHPVVLRFHFIQLWEWDSGAGHVLCGIVGEFESGCNVLWSVSLSLCVCVSVCAPVGFV